MMKKNNVYILEDRGLLYISGEDCKEFLQNIITNNINKVDDKNSCYSALLTPQGKYLYDFNILKHKSGYFLDCEKKNIDNLFKQLNLYKLRSKVEFLNLSNEFVIAVISKERFLDMENSNSNAGSTIKFREDSIFLDPRNKELGARIVTNLEKLYLSLKKLGLQSADKNEYYKLCHEAGIPQSNTEKLQNKIFGIECNFDELNAIDFKKGCYVGQENTARIKLKDKLHKRLLPIEVIEGDLENDIISIEKEEIGKVLINDNYPYAIIKVKNEKFDFDKTFNCGSAKVKIKKPGWLQII
ncbi:folate-binding protein [Candidatus Pelagibacter sp.]|nr:folate-binding protein [Candidatus Pelagibacter sp.]